MPTLVLADVVQRADVRVIEGRDRLGLAPKALESRRRVRERGWEAAVLEATYQDHVQGWVHFLSRLVSYAAVLKARR